MFDDQNICLMLEKLGELHSVVSIVAFLPEHEAIIDLTHLTNNGRVALSLLVRSIKEACNRNTST